MRGAREGTRRTRERREEGGRWRSRSDVERGERREIGRGANDASARTLHPIEAPPCLTASMASAGRVAGSDRGIVSGEGGGGRGREGERNQPRGPPGPDGRSSSGARRGGGARRARTFHLVEPPLRTPGQDVLVVLVAKHDRAGRVTRRGLGAEWPMPQRRATRVFFTHECTPVQIGRARVSNRDRRLVVPIVSS